MDRAAVLDIRWWGEWGASVLLMVLVALENKRHLVRFRCKIVKCILRQRS